MKTLLQESLNVTDHATINSGLALLGLMTFLITQSHENQAEANYNSVTDHVTKHIVNEKKAVSVAVLHTIYGLKPNNTTLPFKVTLRYPVFSEHWT